MTKKIKKLKTVDTLESNDCRWPIGDPRHPEFHFCGAPRVGGRPYCAAHWQMAFQPARPRTQPAPLICLTVGLPSPTARSHSRTRLQVSPIVGMAGSPADCDLSADSQWSK